LNYTRYLILLPVLILAGSNLPAQPPEIDWFKGFGTDTEEHVHEGMQTSDSGYIAIGHGIETANSDDMLIIKTDKDGRFEWKQEFGTKYKKGAGYCITEISNGYIAGGAIFDPDSQRTQRFLAKIDFSGGVVWEKFYGSEGVGGIRAIDRTKDGGMVVTGYKNTPDINEFRGFVFIVDDGDGFIMKLDLSGNVEWEKSIEANQGTKVREIENGYAVCSTVWTWTQETGDHQDFCLIKTDSDGKTIWRKLYGGTKGDHLYDFDLTWDGGFILAGHTVSYGVLNWDYLMMKVDSAGIKEWHKIFGQPRDYDAQYIHDEAYGVRQTPDGGYVICGGSGDEYEEYSGSGHPAGSSNEWKVYLVKTDKAGEITWEGIYPPRSAKNNSGEYIGLTRDGGYIVFVDTDSQTPPEPNNFGYLKLAKETISNIQKVPQHTIQGYQLFQNYPNPFNPVTYISFEIPVSNTVKIEVYNSLGRQIETLYNNQLSAGHHQVEFNGSEIASGIYYYRITTGSFEQTRKCILMK
jgi:hypothetical protein